MKKSVFYDHLIEACSQSGLPIEQVVSKIRDMGVDAVEINLTMLLNDEEHISRMLHENDLKISSIYEMYDWGNKPDPARAKVQVDTAAKYDAGRILVVPGFLSPMETRHLKKVSTYKEKLFDFMDHDKKIENMKRVLIEVTDYAMSKGVTVTLEDFDSDKAPYATSDELEWFMKNVDGLRLTFDCGNFAYSDEDASKAYQKLKDSIVHVHCKDRGIDPKMKKSLKNNRGLVTVPTGGGYLPLKKILTDLIRNGYHGYFVIEHFNAADQLVTIESSVKFLNEIDKCNA